MVKDWLLFQETVNENYLKIKKKNQKDNENKPKCKKNVLQFFSSLPVKPKWSYSAWGKLVIFKVSSWTAKLILRSKKQKGNTSFPAQFILTWSILLTSKHNQLLSKTQQSYLFTASNMLFISSLTNLQSFETSLPWDVSRKASLLIIWSCCNSIPAAESSLKPLQILKYLPESLTVCEGLCPLSLCTYNPHQYCAHMYHLSLTLIQRHRQTCSTRRPISRAKRYLKWEKQSTLRTLIAWILCMIWKRGRKGMGEAANGF